ncbi:MAG: N-acetylmuramoyl-L-alanine amidase [Ignavibacteriales bacterium]|nr:MAG: N-acetylmuramoyl-L-alanine amidase [Ignavibacteriales bacterium]
MKITSTNKIFFVVLLLLIAAELHAQITRLEVKTENGTSYIPAFERQGIIYFSIKHLAEVTSVNYYFNSKAEKIELKPESYRIKITARNPYIHIIAKQKSGDVIQQIPTSTYLQDDNIYIPVVYSMEMLRMMYGKVVEFESPSRLIITGEKYVKGSESFINEKSGFDIYGISIDEKANGTLVRIKSKKRIPSYNSSFKDGVLTLIFRSVKCDEQVLTKSGEKGLIREIKAKNIKNDTELKFSLSKEYTTSEVMNAEGSNDILITIHNKIFSGNDITNKNKSKWNFDVIVIDAGHGGKDGGAIGVNGVKEKDVNLGVALKLGKLIESSLKDVKVVYTRNNDTFVELYKRGKIANDQSGKLFISIHCNSTPKKPTDANGFEVYLLRPGRTQEAINIAERENSVIEYEEDPKRYQKLTDENFILVSMAHSAYMKYSEKFADLLNLQFSNDLSLASRGVKQAGFYVLVGASMPSVLIETGFLSNKKDAEYLKSTNGQKQIANSIFNAIKNFKEYYEKMIDSE